MRQFLLATFFLCLLLLWWYLDEVFKVNGLAVLNFDAGRVDTFFGWQVLWKAWPLTLVGGLVGFVITIGVGILTLIPARNADHRRQMTNMKSRVQQAEDMAATAWETAVYTANQRVADRENALSQRENEVAELKKTILTKIERATQLAEAEANGRVAARESALLTREKTAQLATQQAEHMQQEAITAIAAAQAEVNTEKYKAHNASAAFKRVSKKARKAPLPPKAKPQPTSPQTLEQSDEMPIPPEEFNPLEWMEKMEQWEKNRQQANEID